MNDKVKAVLIIVAVTVSMVACILSVIALVAAGGG